MGEGEGVAVAVAGAVGEGRGEEEGEGDRPELALAVALWGALAEGRAVPDREEDPVAEAERGALREAEGLGEGERVPVEVGEREAREVEDFVPAEVRVGVVDTVPVRVPRGEAVSEGEGEWVALQLGVATTEAKSVGRALGVSGPPDAVGMSEALGAALKPPVPDAVRLTEGDSEGLAEGVELAAGEGTAPWSEEVGQFVALGDSDTEALGVTDSEALGVTDTEALGVTDTLRLWEAEELPEELSEALGLSSWRARPCHEGTRGCTGWTGTRRRKKRISPICLGYFTKILL